MKDQKRLSAKRRLSSKRPPAATVDVTQSETPIPDSLADLNFGVYILGAGFSAPAGLPLASALWKEIRVRGRKLFGSDSHFEYDLQHFIEFKKRCFGLDLHPEDVDFEEFMGFLDIEHYLGLLGKDTWSSEGNETQVLVKGLIGQILVERTPPPNKIPDLYLKFAAKLSRTDYVLTFNYDVLLERSLEVVGIPYRLHQDRLKEITPDGSTAIIDTSKEELVLLKLHGSIDWFDRTRFLALKKAYQRAGGDQTPSDPVFDGRVKITPLVEGPRFSTDPLVDIYRVSDIERIYNDVSLASEPPVILNPSPVKLVYSQRFHDFWWGLGGLGRLNFTLAIIGFSLPPQDEYARQVLYRVARNYQETHWNERIFRGSKKKSPAAVVTLCNSEVERDEFFRRYAFVDWSKATAHLKGFDETVLAAL